MRLEDLKFFILEQTLHHQINKSLLKQLHEDSSNGMYKNGNMYGNIKIHKENNYVRVIKSASNMLLGNLTILVKNALFEVGSHLPSQIKYTCNMLKLLMI